MKETKNIENVVEAVETTLPAADEIVARTGLGTGGKVAVAVALGTIVVGCTVKAINFFKNKKAANDEIEGDEGTEPPANEDFDADAE